MGTIVDNDSPGITITPNSANGATDANGKLITTEAGGTNTFSVKLNSQPTADVTVTLTGLDATEGSLSTTTLTFTAANWNTAQTVTVTGANDDLVDGDISYTLTATANNAGGYNGQTQTVSVINQDNDSLGITITPNSANGATDANGKLITTEAGGTNTFSVKLNSQPTADVTVTLTGLDATEGSLSTTTLTFTAANWNTAQTVTVTGANDDLVDGDISYTLTATANNAGGYNGQTQTVSVINQDNDSLGITITPNSANGATDANGKLITTEAGGTNTFSVKLNSQPTADVTVTLTGLDATEGSLSTTTLTFTAANWNTAQTVTVTGANDDLVDGDISYTLTATANNAGGYNGQTQTVSVINQDNDSLGITITPNSANGATDANGKLITTEAGGTNTFSVKLSSQPTADVTVTLTGLDATEGSLSTTTLTFTAANWNTAQTVTVTGVDDSEVDGDISYTLTATANNAGGYNGQTQTVSVINQDNDSLGITITPNSANGATDANGKLITTEAGGTNTFSVKLNSQPTADVTVTLTGLDATEGSLSTTTLTFTAANWNTAQTVTVTGVDDSEVDGDISYTLTATANNAGGYNGQTQTVSVINQDNDSLGITITPNSANGATDANGKLITTEAGGTNTFSVKLNSQPTADVTVTLTGLDATEGSLSTTTLTFTAANWNTAQTVTVTGANDDLVDGDISYTLTATANNAGGYNGQTQTVSVINQDNDSLGITITPNSANGATDANGKLITTEAGGTNTFSVKLNSQPTADVTVTLTGLDATEGSLSTTTLTFTAANWNTAQTVTVTGANDDLVDGDISYTLTATANNAGGYNGQTQTVSVINQDNDSLGITITPNSANGATDANGKLITTEAGGTNTFSVKLNSQPTADVTVTLTGLDPTEGTLSTTTLTFTAANWNTAQTVTVTGINDDQEDGDISYTLTATANNAGGYNGQTQTVDVVNKDIGVPAQPAPVTPPKVPVIPAPEPVSPFGAILDPATDNGGSNEDLVTSIIEPEFTISAPGALVPGYVARLLDPSGQPIGDATVTPEDVNRGTINVPTIPLDDGTYTFMAQIVDDTGAVVGEAPVTVTIITDRDGVMPSVERSANGGDFNQDGIADWEQNNVAQLPLASLDAYRAGAQAPTSSFGAIMAGNLTDNQGSGNVALTPSAQLLDISLQETPAPVPENLNAVSPTLNFSVTSEDNASLQDMSPETAGLQTRVVIDLPEGVKADTYLKWRADTASWAEFLDDQDLSTYDDGATLIDRDGDGLVDRIVVTLTDGGFGDEDGLVNGVIVDPGVLAARKPGSVYSVILDSGDRYLTSDAAEAAAVARGAENRFEGVLFDSLDANTSAAQLHANYNLYTDDWYFAFANAEMPYFCYEAMDGAGFFATRAGSGVGDDYHLYLRNDGLTRLITKADAQTEGLASKGYVDLGARFNTTSGNAFDFDPEGYLLANQAMQDIQDFVQGLASTYSRTSDAGFVEAVEQHYFGHIDVVGMAPGTAASAADLNSVFGTGFLV